jgi:hypothetical protein
VTRLRPVWLLLLALAAPLSGQELRLVGRENTAAVRLAREILADARYLRIDRDTTLPESFRAPADLVIVDAEVRLEGTVEGRVAVLGGDLFVRPRAQVAGPIAVVGGAVYPSRLATIGPVVEDSVPLEVAVEPGPTGDAVGTVRVLPPYRPAGLTVGPLLPTYDRVNGLTLAAGPRWLLTREEDGPSLGAWFSYRTARQSFGGGAELQYPFGDSLYLRARVARETVTNEEWIRGPLSNTGSSLLAGTDERDYYEADRVSLTFGRLENRAPAQGATDFAPRLTLLLSRDRSLDARDPWSLFGDLDRVNLPVDEGTLLSALGGVGLHWKGRLSTFVGDAGVEQGLGGAGDFAFTRWLVDGLWTSVALGRHQVAVRFRGIGTVGEDPAPRQRWSFVGGPNTLPAFDIAEMRGDRLAYVQSSYGIPFEKVVLPVLGFPTLRFVHVTGAAWVTGEPMPAWLQNLGAGVLFSFVRAEVYVDPTADDLSPHLSVGLVLPGFR